MSDTDEEAFFEVWFNLERRKHWDRLYPKETFHENWGLADKSAMRIAWMARASLHVSYATNG